MLDALDLTTVVRDGFLRMHKQPIDIAELDGGPYVYFMVSGGHVKIGTSINVQRRLYDVKSRKARSKNQGVVTPPEVDRSKLIIAAAVPGGAHVERAMHHRFAKQRITGEWFMLTDELWQVIRDAQYTQSHCDAALTEAHYETGREHFPDLPAFKYDEAQREAHSRLSDRLITPDFCQESERFDRGYIA